MTERAVLAILAPPAARVRPRASRALVAGAAILLAILGACLATLPYTLARDVDGIPRYNAGHERA